MDDSKSGIAGADFNEEKPKKKRRRTAKKKAEPQVTKQIHLEEVGEVTPSSTEVLPTTLFLKNKREEISHLEDQIPFWDGLKTIQDKFYREVRAYGDQHRIEINTVVQFELTK